MTAIDDIKAKLNIVEYIGSTVPLKKAGRYWKACCPFHQEHTASFMVSEDKQAWRCYGSCADGGDIFDFAKRLNNWSFQEALEELAKLAGVELEQPTESQRAKKETTERLLGLMAAATDSYHRCLLEFPGAAEARAYLERRGMTAETVERFQFGFAPSSPDSKRLMTGNLLRLGYSEDDVIQCGVARRNDKGQVVDFLYNRLIIPIRDDRGRVIAFAGRTLDGSEPKYMNTPESPIFHKEQVLFAYRRENIHETAVIVEGYMDAISAHQAGHFNVVAQMGTALTEPQTKILARTRAQRIILALDGDAAGQNATRRGLEIAIKSELNVLILTLPDGKDPDDVLRESPESWPNLVRDAIPVADYLIEFEASKLQPNATIREREALAKSLLPLLMASESNLYRLDSIQKLALRLRLPEAELMSMARMQAPKPQPVVRTEQQPAKRQPSPIEAYCVRAMLYSAEWYEQVHREFINLEMDPLSGDDFADFKPVIEVYRDAWLSGAPDLTAFVYENIDPVFHPLLDSMGDEPLHYDVFLREALRLRCRRFQAEVEQLAVIEDLPAMRARTKLIARSTERMKAIPWKG